MKAKNIFMGISIVIGIIALAAGVAVIIDKYLNKNNECADGYIECDCSPEELSEQ